MSFDPAWFLPPARSIVLASYSTVYNVVSTCKCKSHRHLLNDVYLLCRNFVNYSLSSLQPIIVSAHRRILGMASVVCVLVKICVSSILLYKLDTDKLTAPFESAHQFTLVCTVSDSKTVPGCHYNLCSNHSFVLTD